ncbi:MAG: fibronectin type III domain-containing protein [Candidatus Thermoplasmatota archaeon]
MNKLVWLFGLVLLGILIGIGLNASAADGSGTNFVSPTSATAGSTGNTFTFTFTAAEEMGSGEISITAPTGWSAPQGTSGTAGYTTASSTGTIGKVVSNLDATTGWGGATGYTLSADTTVKKEGTASLKCNIPANTAAGSWYYNYGSAQNWASYTKMSFWIYSDVATSGGDFRLRLSESANLGTVDDNINIPALAANTWTYVVWTFGGATTTRDAVLSYGIYNESSITTGVNMYLDEILIGPDNTAGISFSGQDIKVRILALANTQTITVTYGSGGGASGVTVQNCVATLTLTTKSKISVSGTLTAIAFSPTITINPATMTRLVITLPGETFTPCSGNSGTVTAQTAGTAFNLVGINATDDYFNVVTSYTGTKTLAYSGPGTAGGSNPSYTTSVDFTNGQSTTTPLATTLYKAETVKITVTNETGAYGYASSSLTVNPGAMTRLVITLPGQTFTVASGNSGTVTAQTAGTSFNLVGINASDNWFNVVTTYTGAKTLTYSGPANSPDGQVPSYTTAVDFTNGQSTTILVTTLYKAEIVTITVTDSGSYGYASSSLTVKHADPNRLEIAGATTMTAGTTNELTITAKDAYGNVADGANGATAYTGAHNLVFYGLAESPKGYVPTVESVNFGTAVSIAFTNGVSDANVATLIAYKAETATVDVYETAGISSNASAAYDLDLTVNHAPADYYNIGANTTQTAGVAFDINVTVHDAYGNIATTYTGTINFTSTALPSPDGTKPVLPDNYTFVAGDNGYKSFPLNITLYKNETAMIIVMDNVTSTINGTITITVMHGLANKLNLIAGKEQIAGEPFNVTVIAFDNWNNTVLNYSGRVELSGNAEDAPDGTKPNYGPAYTYNASTDNGTYNFTVILYKAQKYIWIKANDTAGISGIIGEINVTHNLVYELNLRTTDGSAEVEAGLGFAIEVMAWDEWHNIVLNYAGTVSITSTAGNAPDGTPPTYPSPYEFNLTDQGVHIISGIALFKAEEDVEIYATDENGIYGSIILNVLHGKVASFELICGKEQIAGVPFNVTVTALDSWKNIVKNYVGSVQLTGNAGNSPDNSQPIYGGPVEFTVLDNGMKVIGGTILFKAEKNVTITAVDVNYQNIKGSVSEINVKFASLARFKLEFEKEQTAGMPFNVTITALDNWGNTVENFTGEVNLSGERVGSAPGAPPYFGINNPCTFEEVDKGRKNITGVRLFKAESGVKLKLTFRDIVSISDEINVTFASFYEFGIEVEAGIKIAGKSFSVTLTALDQWKNVVTNYKGKVSISSTANPSPNGDLPLYIDVYNFTDADKGKHTFSFTFYCAEEMVSITFKDLVIDKSNKTDVSIGHDEIVGFRVSAGKEQTAGVAFDVTVEAIDRYGNTVKNYFGQISFEVDAQKSPSGAGPSKPGLYTFTEMDRGRHTFVKGVTLYCAGENVTITVSEVQKPSIRGSITGISVSFNKIAKFYLKTEKEVYAGEPFNLIVTALDPWHNIVLNYVGTIKITSNASAIGDKKPSYPDIYKFKIEDAGVAKLTITFYKKEIVSIMASDDVIGVFGELAIDVKDDTAPDRSEIIAKKDITGTTAKIEWKRSTAKDFGRYEIWRAKKDKEFKLVATIKDINQTSYVLKDLEPETEYFVKITTYDYNGNSIDSSVVSLKTGKAGVTIVYWLIIGLIIIVVGIMLGFALGGKRRL